MAGTERLRRTNPEAEGIDPAGVLAFVRALEVHPEHPLDAVQGFMLLRHGNVAAEGWWAPYGPDRPHIMYSLSKSFCSTAIGLAVAEGLLAVDDPVLRFFPDDAPAEPSDHLRAMRVRHLLTMNTGHHEDTTHTVFRGEDDNWPRHFLSLPVEHAPGSWFVYNTAATYMLSAIITRLTGQTLIDYLRPRLFAPLGIDNPRWDSDPRGVNLGGTGLHILTEDVACFGQMYLNGGVWNGQQLVPAAWVVEATRAHSDNSNTQTNPDWTAGYGYQFWRNGPQGYRGDGAFGQYCVVLPEHDAVLVMIGGIRDMQHVLSHVWEHLLPAMQSDATPSGPAAEMNLRDALATLSLPIPVGDAQPSIGISGKSFTLDPNPTGIEYVSLVVGDDHDALTIGVGGEERILLIGHGAWRESHLAIPGRGYPPGRPPAAIVAEPVAASGAWSPGDTYTIHLCCIEAEVGMTLRLSFSERSLRVEIAPSVAWGDTASIALTGMSGG